jgi:hypothetical protein
VIVIALAPQEGHVAAEYLLGAEVVGLLWYLLYLRPRLIRHTVGVYRGASASPAGTEQPAET